MTVEIVGTKDVQNILQNIAPKYAKNLARATVQGVAMEIAKDARKMAPKDSGRLKKAIKAKRKKSPPEAPVSVVYVATGRSSKNNAWYWRFQEYGTGGKNPQDGVRFIRRAYEEARQNLPKIFTEQFGKKLTALLKRERKKLV